MIVILTFLIAAILTLAAVPLAKRIAIRWNLVDRPDTKRKLHSNTIPLIGGIVIFFAVVVTLAIVWAFGEGISFSGPKFFGLLLASAFILLVGLLDDRFEIRGRQKLLGQILAATILISFGFGFEKIQLLESQAINLSVVFSVIAVYVWLLIGINSVNLIDGADGFATTLGLTMSVSLCLISVFAENQPLENALISAAAAGALLGFLRYNFPPASAYLGDAGSMLIGLFIAAMAVHSSSKEFSLYAFIAPIALFSIPMFDTIAAVIRRQLTGRSIYTVDRGHLHHALLRKGFGPRKALFLFFAMCLMTSTGAILAIEYEEPVYAFAAITAVIIFLIVGKVFGFAEFKLISNKIRSLIRSFLYLPKHRTHDLTVRLQGERDWDLCWQVLREFAEKSNFVRFTLDLNLPWLHESFHAKYQQPNRHLARDEQWNAEYPLQINGRLIGRIDMVGCVNQTRFFESMVDLSDVLNSLQPFFIQMMQTREELQIPLEQVAEDTSKEFEEPATPSKDKHALDVR